VSTTLGRGTPTKEIPTQAKEAWVGHLGNVQCTRQVGHPSPPLAVLVKVTSVVPLSMIAMTELEVCVPPRSGGATVIPDTTVPAWGNSVTSTGVPTGYDLPTTQYPAGAGPAGT
jgi:hypothetical protein